jgi:glycosyltransferase involved in cell wall biosynthesis
METMLLSSADQWRSCGYACDVLATKNDVGPLATQMVQAGYGVFHIPFRSSRRYLPNRRLIGDFFRLCRSRQYEIVHIHTEAATPVFAILAKLAGVRHLVLTVHNTFLFEGFLQVRKKLERKVIRGLGGRYGMVSDAVMDCEKARFKNHGVRLWNWLDTDYFRPPSSRERQVARKTLGCSEKQFVLVSVANCNHAKNHSTLLHSLKKIKAESPFLYLHVGKEEDGRPELSLANRLGLDNEVRFVGSQPDPRLYFWAADAFVMPSLHEGLAISPLEAIAAGCPAVLAEVSGLKEIAEITRWTVRVAPEEQSLAAGLLQVATLSEDVRRSRASEDSARVREVFSMRRGVEMMIRDLYTHGFSHHATLKTAIQELS